MCSLILLKFSSLGDCFLLMRTYVFPQVESKSKKTSKPARTESVKVTKLQGASDKLSLTTPEIKQSHMYPSDDEGSPGRCFDYSFSCAHKYFF